MNFYEQIFSRGRATGEGMTHFERLFAAKFGGSPPSEVREYTGAVPVTITADGTPLIDYLISGNTTQSGTPTPENPIMPEGCGELETAGAKAGQYKIPISSAGQTTPIYLGEVQSIRQIKKLVFDGTENWEQASNGCFYWQRSGGAPTDYLSLQQKTIVCSHFKGVSNRTATTYVDDCGICFYYYSGSSSARELYLRYNDAVDVNGFKAFLAAQYVAGTPVIVWYVLAEPETGIVNEPLCKIGNYADTVSKSQAGVSIPTSNGSTMVDVDTIVKPSEVYIKYMG